MSSHAFTTPPQVVDHCIIVTAGSKPASKTPPPLSAFAAARSAALAVRDDSARSSLEDVTADALAAGSPGATSPASAASAAAAGSPAADVMARQLAAAADRAAAGQALQRTAAGSTGSNRNRNLNSTSSGSGGNSGAGTVTSAGSSIMSASSDASNADIETWLLLEYCDLGTLQVAICLVPHVLQLLTSWSFVMMCCQCPLPVLSSEAALVLGALSTLHGPGDGVDEAGCLPRQSGGKLTGTTNLVDSPM